MWGRRGAGTHKSSCELMGPSRLATSQSMSPKFQTVPPDYGVLHVAMALQDSVGSPVKEEEVETRGQHGAGCRICTPR